jgi:RecA/RadA recombinase
MLEIETAYGKGVVAQASRGRSFSTRRFQSMVFDLDAALGGGFPWGKFTMLYGPPSGGKSLALYKSMAGAQLYCRHCRALMLPDQNGEERCGCPTVCDDCGKTFVKTPYEGAEPQPADPFDWEVLHDEWECGCLVAGETKRKADQVPKHTHRASRCRVVLLDIENSFTKSWGVTCGIDPSYTFVPVPEYAEQGIDIAHKLLGSGEIDYLGIDSIAEMVPSTELEETTENWQRGLQARLVNKCFRLLNGSLNGMGADCPTRPAVVFVNQTRTDMEGNETTPGGMGQNYKAAIRLRVNQAKYKFLETGGSEDNPKTKEVRYAEVAGYTQKNKTYTPRVNFSFKFYLADRDGFAAGSTDEFGVVVERALEFEVIARPKTSQYVYGSYEWSTQKAIVEALKADVHLFWQLRDVTMEKVVKVRA